MHTAHNESVRVGLQNEMIVTKRFLVGRCAGSIYLSTTGGSSDFDREYYVSVAGATVGQSCSGWVRGDWSEGERVTGADVSCPLQFLHLTKSQKRKALVDEESTLTGRS